MLQSRTVISCSPSSAQSFLVSGPVGTHHIFVRSNTASNILPKCNFCLCFLFPISDIIENTVRYCHLLVTRHEVWISN
jgi:hypothetical protein